jgi:cellulose biosynthesis protein BcsQ
MRYCTWNNKGGVGKTFLTYCLAVEYAKKHPQKVVAVVDSCPQSNISEMLLGGNGPGEQRLVKLYEDRRTIASYIIDRRRKGWETKVGDEISYFVKIHNYNENLPQNLFLLPGDFDLDNCVEVINHIETDPLIKRAWLSSRMFLKEIISVFEGSHKKETVVFIDTNPSFSNYTQAAIAAANRLIVPCTADYASLRGIHNVFYRLFGASTIEGRVNEDTVLAFSQKATETGLILPKVHTFVLNKSRSQDKNAAKAYLSHAKEMESIANTLVKEHEDYFSNNDGNYFMNVKDGNTLSTVINHGGLMPSTLQPGQYMVYEDEITVNQTQIVPFVNNITNVVQTL